ncbi:FtsK/SpoIIIE domain-containing protein [Rathayibacter sp. YIM 133350]|uniref:FtsK/SpoIIIE domain-containing protein n=1 Tax=Rathayibacter sp. YIM 133350 TaxID=3131992 RepID=UPI00307FC892
MSTGLPSERVLRLPPRETPPPRPAFPLLASIAPMLVAGALFAITRSPFALLFAVFGPVAAVAALLDAARTRRLAARRAGRAESEALDELCRRIDDAHERERRAAWEAHPSAATSLLRGESDVRRWKASEPTSVVLGTAELPSGIRVEHDGEPHEPGDPRDAGDPRVAVLDRAAVAAGMPLVVSVAGGIGIIGVQRLGRALARGIVLQLCTELSPARLGVRCDLEEPWLRSLPHRVGAAPASGAVTVLLRSERGAAPADALTIALGSSLAALPEGCRTVVAVRGPAEAEVLTGDGAGRSFVPELVSEQQADAHARSLRASAARLAQPDLPAEAAWESLPAAPREGLAATLGVSPDGPLVIDLVCEGPHALVGGTTGSGKSELLITWIVGMAVGRSPDEFAFLLVDFKGGATASAVQALPHCIGVVTDLDGALAERMLLSLAAELRERERILANNGVPDIARLRGGTLPRLVVVVDELAALLSAAPAAHELLADIAARGRSLGVHLILCGQRPAGVARESLLANCGLRICLRVTVPTDSTAMIGTPQAAGIERSMPGRAFLGSPAGPIECQLAVVAPVSLASVASRSHAGPRPRRAWLAPLPAEIRSDAPIVEETVRWDPVPSGAVLLGLCDDPASQRRRTASWSMHAGALLVVGSAKAGCSNVLELIAGGGGHPLVRDEAALWDALAGPPGGAAAAPLLIDDFDVLLERMDLEYRQAALPALAAQIRSGRPVAVATRRPAQLGGLVGLFDQRLVLRLTERTDHVALGAPGVLWDPRSAVGSGTWKGLAFQALRAPSGLPTPSSPSTSSPLPPADRTLVVVSSRPAVTAAALRAAGRAVMLLSGGRGLDVAASGAGTAIVGDPDAWQAEFSAFTALRRECAVLFHGCSLADYRLLARTRELPPLLTGDSGLAWLRDVEGVTVRTRLPGGTYG